MRVKNVSLYDQNQELTEVNKELLREREGLVLLVKNLNTELDQLTTSSMAKERKLRAELKAMQASWDSLYEEHSAAEERRKRELQLKNITPEDDRINHQAELLRSAVKKQSAQSEMVSPMEQKLHEMEAENKKLKSKVVQLQTKYKEEKYKNENGIKDHDSASTTDSESVSSIEQKGSVNLLAGFSKRKMGPRPTSTSARVPKFQTKNLWGRMTSPKSSRPEFEFSTINLAFSREE